VIGPSGPVLCFPWRWSKGLRVEPSAYLLEGLGFGPKNCGGYIYTRMTGDSLKSIAAPFDSAIFHYLPAILWIPDIAFAYFLL